MRLVHDWTGRGEARGRRATKGRHMSIRKLVAGVALLGVGLSGAIAAATPSAADSLSPITINDVTMPRPASGTASFVFTVTLEYPSNNTVTVPYATADSSARSTFDYQ